MSKIDVIILSLAIEEKGFNTTKKCIDSYIETADKLIGNIFVIETNKNFNKDYNQPKVKVIIPPFEFNYNQFYNIGLSMCRSEYVIGPNNDLIIQENCIQNIVKEFENNSVISSISPIDRDWHRHTKLYFPNDNKLYYGYETSLHLFGCIFAVRRKVFETIGYLDERFFFFYQDNDYSMCLERNNIIHGVLTSARVKHKIGGTSEHGSARTEYTPHNMNTQGDLLGQKWNNEEPFKSGGFKKFKEYTL
jgi:glycosyltransferase involved in cell wall biosynthesis